MLMALSKTIGIELGFEKQASGAVFQHPVNAQRVFEKLHKFPKLLDKNKYAGYALFA